MLTIQARVSVLLVVTLLLAACGPSPQPTAVPPSAVPTMATPEAKKAPVVTLTVWDQFERETERALIDRLNAEFEAAHPAVKINRVVMSFDALRLAVGPALSDPEGPDVVQVNQGADMRAAVQANLLLDLTPYLPVYRWDQRFSASVLARSSYSADGGQFGTGNLYGVSPTAEVVGVYYNKEKFEKLGYKVPEAFSEFEALMARAKADGEAPLMLGNRERSPGMHIFSAIEHVLLPDRTWLDDFVYGRSDVSFDIPENLQAAARVQEWVKAGYFVRGFANTSNENAWHRFAGGEGLMMIAGSWLSAEIVHTGGERFGFFLLPPQQEGAVLAIGGVGLPFSIRRGTTHASLAAEYVDWMVSPNAGEVWLEAGVLPAVPMHASRIPSGTLVGDIVAAYGALNVTDGVGHYIDWAGPTMYDLIGESVQELMALKITPEAFVAKIQAADAQKP